MAFRVQLTESEFFEILHVLVFETDRRRGDIGAGIEGSCELRQRDCHCAFADSGRCRKKNVVGFTNPLTNEIKSLSLRRPPLRKREKGLPQHLLIVLKIRSRSYRLRPPSRLGTTPLTLW